MKLIYLQLYKDTYLIFMQAFKPLQRTLNYFENLRKEKIVVSKIQNFNNSKVRVPNRE